MEKNMFEQTIENKVTFCIDEIFTDIKSCENNEDKKKVLINYLKSNNISYKFTESSNNCDSENLVIIYNNYHSLGKNKLEYECRSIVLDYIKPEIINYTFQRYV